MKSILFYLTFTVSVFCGTAPQYAVIDIPAPPSKFKNIQIDGLTFLPNGKLVVCLPSGEIFFRDLKTETWALFAEGLHNPLGVIARSNSELIIAQLLRLYQQWHLKHCRRRPSRHSGRNCHVTSWVRQACLLYAC